MKETVNTRLSSFMEKKGLSKFSLSKLLEVSPSAIGYIVGERQSKPSADMLVKLGTACPELDLNWLITGRGTMLFDQSAVDTECWALLESERARRTQLQADYDALILRFQQREA